jgi:hypothetical protein
MRFPSRRATGAQPRAAPTPTRNVYHSIPVSLEQVMKKSMLVCLVLAIAALSGCANKRDITDEIAQVAAPAAQA